MDKLKAIESFVTVAKTGNFANAAKRLGVSRAMVGKRIVQLEEHLKVRLFHRTTRTTSLTDEGSRYVELWSGILSHVEEEEKSLLHESSELRGVLRVVASRSIGVLHISSIVAQFSKAYPELRVELVLASTPRNSVQLFEQGFDISIRVAAPPSASRVIARKLADYDWILCAAPSYVEKFGEPRAPRDLLQHHCMTAPQMNPQLRYGADWVFHRGARRVSESIMPSVSVNSVIALRRMTLEGAGLSRLPSYCVKQDLADGGLVRVMPQYALDRGVIYAVYYRERPASQKIRLFVETLRAGLRGKL